MSRPAGSRERKRQRHGFKPVKRALQLRGLEALDQRTGTAIRLREMREALLVDLGGEAELSQQQLMLVDQVVRLQALIDHIDTWLFEDPSRILAKKRRAVYPIVRERNGLVSTQRELLRDLGLERRTKPARAWQEVKAETVQPGTDPERSDPGGS